MAPVETKGEYESQYQSSGVVTAPGADTDLVVVEVSKESQLTRVHITAGESNNFRVERRDQDGSNAEVVATYSAVTEKAEGEFENPVAEAGAQKEYAVVVDDAGSADVDYSANVRVDEHTGK